MRTFTLLITALALPLSGAAQASQPNYADKYWRDMKGGFTVDINDPMPPMRFATSDGDEYDSDILAGQPVLLQFVTSWCPYSEEQMRHIQGLSDRFSPNALFFCVSVDERPDSALFAQIHANSEAKYPVVYDFEERLLTLFAPRHATLPRVVIFGADGKVKGLFDEHSKRMTRIMRRVIKRNMKRI